MLKGTEAIDSELVGQAHIETVALKLFDFADLEDKEGKFGRLEGCT